MEKLDITTQFKFLKRGPNVRDPRMCYDKISEVIYLLAIKGHTHNFPYHYRLPEMGERRDIVDMTET